MLKMRFQILRTIDEVLLKRGRPSPTQVQLHPSSCKSTPIRACKERCTQTLTPVYLSWNFARCTLKTSSTEASLWGGGELICIVHWEQFQPKSQWGGSQAPRCRACEARGTYLADLRDESVEVLPLFWSTSNEDTHNKGNKNSRI